ncbi:MAG: selenium cofactor biosynthesis protein YqeC [Planctomycetota bacterium JB042]
MPAELAPLLGIADGDVVAVVGAGGKHTLMAHLADELPAAGRPVVLTTTTNLHRGALETIPCVRMAEPGWQEALAAALEAVRRAVVVDRAKGPGMEVGLEPTDDSFARLRAAARGATIVVKADGARKRLLKAPGRPDEPAWPQVADRTVVDRAVVVCALSAIGKPLDDAHVHRLEAVRALCADDPVDESTIVAVATRGYAEEIPFSETTTASLFLSHAVDDAALRHARAIAAGVGPLYESVVAADTIEGRFTLLTGPPSA